MVGGMKIVEPATLFEVTTNFSSFLGLGTSCASQSMGDEEAVHEEVDEKCLSNESKR